MAKKAEKKEYDWITTRDVDGNILKVKVDKNTGQIEDIKNPNFIQFVKDGYPAVKQLLREKPLAGNLFLWLIEYMDDYNRLIVSYDALVEEFGKSRQTMSTAVKYLKDNKFLTVLKSGSSNIYCLNSNIVWQNKADKREYASFSCAVYITKKEQQYRKDFIPKIVKK